MGGSKPVKPFDKGMQGEGHTSRGGSPLALQQEKTMTGTNPTNVKYKNRYKRKAPTRSDHLKKYWWKPGESGNKDGRPTGSISLVESLKAFLRRNPQALEEIVISLVNEGRLGNMVATKEILDRVDGRVVERHKLEGVMPVKILFVPAQEVIDVAETPQNPNLGVSEDKQVDLLTEGT